MVEVVKSWKENDSARILAYMDPEKVAKVLEKLNADQASKISQTIEKQASKIKDNEEGSDQG